MIYEAVFKHFSKIIVIVLTLCANKASFAEYFNKFETTRMKSTAGAGVGSILIDEGTFLNPAPAAFFTVSSVYVQKIKSGFTPNSSTSSLGMYKSDTDAVIISDAKGGLKGSLSYYKQKQRSNERKRLGTSMAKAFGKKSAIGVAYRHTWDRINDEGLSEVAFSEIVLGVSHLIGKGDGYIFTMGMIGMIPQKEREDDSVVEIGFTYDYSNFIMLMLDIGADYNTALSSSFLYRAAAQLKVFEDFYIRFGTFENKNEKRRGNGLGIGWVQPKLVLEAAMKNTIISEVEEISQNGEDLKETSFSLSYRF